LQHNTSRPSYLRALHRAVGELVDRQLLSDELEFSALTQSAARATGLTDFGPDDWQEPLRYLLQDFAGCAELNSTGRVIARKLVLGLLRNRLRLVARYSSINPTDIERPVFIVGLPRTGSTLLHELCGSTSAFRTPTFWQSETLPDGNWTDAAKIATSGARIAFLNALAPDFRHIHRLGALLPHECVTIQALSFRSMQFFAIHNVASYHAWLAQCDWGPAYEWHQRYLQVMQGNGGNVRWLLKAPGHMLGITALLERYPDARFVQLHRHPCEVIPSMASLYANLRQSCSDRVDLAAIGEAVVEQWRCGIDRLDAARRENDVDWRFIDVDYRRLVDDPLGCCLDVFDFLGADVTAHDHAAMCRYLEHHPRNKSARHEYTLAQFGLEPSQIESGFAGYITRFC